MTSAALPNLPNPQEIRHEAITILLERMGM